MVWVENGNASVIFKCNDSKKNIFLIGDSIRKGYCETVKNTLSNDAEVFCFGDNCRSSQYIIFNLKKWANMFDDTGKVDIVHFNCGHWDVAHWNGYEFSLTSVEEYAKNIRAIIRLLEKFFPNAKLIFATTTPMNPDGGSTGGVNPRSSEEIDRYNSVAVKVATELGVIINDLNGYMKNWTSAYYIDTCHLTPSAFALLGEEVAHQLKKHL